MEFLKSRICVAQDFNVSPWHALLSSACHLLPSTPTVHLLGACLWQTPESVEVFNRVVWDPGVSPSVSLFRRASGLCMSVRPVFRLTNPRGCVFTRSQANYAIKALINVVMFILYVVVGPSLNKGEQQRICLCLDEQMGICCAGLERRRTHWC